MRANHGFTDDLEHIGLIKRLADGRIVQIGMTQKQQMMLQLSLNAIHQDKTLIILPSEYDLVLVSEVY